MHLPRLATLFTYLIALASTSPVAWPDDKLEEINAMRAKGISEVSRLSQAFSHSQLCFPAACYLQTPKGTRLPFPLIYNFSL